MAENTGKTSTNSDAKPSDGKAAAAAAADPLLGTTTAGVADAGGEEAHERLVKSDDHVHEAIPGAKGPEAIGSGQPLPEAAADAMTARREAGVPEPPKVGPIPNTDLYDTPGGYQVVPAGFTPASLDQANAANAVIVAGPSKVTVESSEKHSEQVAGSGDKTVSE